LIYGVPGYESGFTSSDLEATPDWVATSEKLEETGKSSIHLFLLSYL